MTSQNLKYSLISLITSFSLLLRYPSTNHPSGVDSFLIMIHSVILHDRGEIPWLINIFSAMDIYPLSEEIGIPILLTAITLITEIPLDYTTLLWSLVFGLLGTFGAFILAHEIKGNFYVSLFSALIFTGTPAF